MEVLSHAWRTDLALLHHAGSAVDHHATYVVVRTPDNPTYRWGNFMLLRRTPLIRDVAGVLALFAQHFPEARHQALGIDDPHGRLEDLVRFEDVGFRAEASTVLSTDAVRPPPHQNHHAQVRRLETDADWEQRVALSLACNTAEPSEQYAEFVTRKAASERRMADGRFGAWFGCFDGARMLSGLGIFRAGDGLARFQHVETHPESRGRGLAGTLVHAAGRHALEQLAARRLVIVADNDHHAISIYRAVGFGGTETQLQVEKH